MTVSSRSSVRWAEIAPGVAVALAIVLSSAAHASIDVRVRAMLTFWDEVGELPDVEFLICAGWRDGAVRGALEMLRARISITLAQEARE